MRDNTVIVIDLSNYIKPEAVPFKGIVIDKFDHELVVKSETTGKFYDIYYNQILEGLDIEAIKRILDLDKMRGDE